MTSLTARRALMGLGHMTRSAHAEEAHQDGEHLSALDEHEAHGPEEYTMDVRVIAIFAIAVAAMLCGLPPLFMRAFQSPDTTIARIARAFSGGIILSLALVHIVPEAVMELNEVIDFPIGGVTVLFGILALVVIDSTLTALWAPEDYKDDLRAGRSGSHGTESATVIKPLGAHCHSHASPKDVAREVTLTEDAAANPSAHTHTHACTSALTAQRWIGSVGAPLSNVKQRVTAYTMELGCIFHSIIIGVGVGVITGDRQLVIVLMIALIVHQGLEGLSLGTVLALTRFPMAKKVVMVLIYSITTSVGIAIGIAVSKGYDPDSVVSKAVQGTLNGISGGMLIYISMYQLIAEEFSREDLVVKGKLRAGMIAGLLLGAASMIILAIWS